MILKCTCNHESQDELYGKNKRVFNLCKKNNVKTARCTVCNKEIQIS